MVLNSEVVLILGGLNSDILLHTKILKFSSSGPLASDA